jgi:hypothetical protein
MVLILALTIALTYDVFKIRKNYAAMRLGEERLSTRIQLAERSVLKYWKGLSIPEGEVAYKYILERALKSFLHFNELTPGSDPVCKLRTRVLKDIGAYLKTAKRVAKHIYELAYGKAGSDKAVPKRERMCEMSDLMEHFQFLIVADDCGEEQICEPAALSALSSFTAINQHYTYTLVTKDDCKDTMGNDEGVSESVVEMLVEDTEEQPCFVQINSD